MVKKREAVKEPRRCPFCDVDIGEAACAQALHKAIQDYLNEHEEGGKGNGKKE